VIGYSNPTALAVTSKGLPPAPRSHEALAGGEELVLSAVLDAFEQPAFVLVDGAVLLDNAAAREQGRRPPWLTDRPPEACARATRIRVGGLAAVLVVGRHVRPAGCDTCGRPERSQGLSQLPPSLSGVARLLGEGLSDKEIASDTGLTLPTVRTYARRIFTRLGVHSRREIIGLVRGGADEPEAQPDLVRLGLKGS
jgi:hypothetical protein